MILVVGGLGAGKRDFVTSKLGYQPEEMSNVFLKNSTVLYDLQTITPLPKLEQLLEKDVVICNEVGCGVVPMERSDREWRENVGRLCCQLAEKADSVYRVTCGIGMKLK